MVIKGKNYTLRMSTQTINISLFNLKLLNCILKNKDNAKDVSSGKNDFSALCTALCTFRIVPTAAERLKRTVQIDSSTVEIEERGVKLRSVCRTKLKLVICCCKQKIPFIITNESS